MKTIIQILKKIKFNFTRTSYSQAGEDAIVRYLFNDYGLKSITYLDLGTNIPDYCNNTYWFYKNKSRGVCVEADSSLIENIKKSRPRDKVINVGVSVSNEKEADFYIFNEPAINTFNKLEADERSISGKYKIIKVNKVPLLNINDIISDNFKSYPDYLSIDIEGLDLDVLKSLNFSIYPIPVICVETCTYSENHIRPKDQTISEFMGTVGYEIYADTYLNTIFINKAWFYFQGKGK